MRNSYSIGNQDEYISFLKSRDRYPEKGFDNEDWYDALEMMDLFVDFCEDTEEGDGDNEDKN